MPFIDQYNWKDWKKSELNNESIALNIFYVPYNTKEIRCAYKSKYYLNCKNQVILLMITDGRKWHYLAVKKLHALLRRITSKHVGDFYCLNCFHSFRTENRLKKHKKVCENHDYCYVEMPGEGNKILKYNHGEKSMRFPFVIFADLECLLEKMNACFNDPEKSSTTKISKYAPSGFSMFTCCSFDTTGKDELDCYGGKDCMKEFCKVLKKHVTRIINCEKEKMIPLTKKEEKMHNKQKNVIYAKKDLVLMMTKKQHLKVKDHCHYKGKYKGAAHNICNLRYKTLRDIPVVFHNGSTYDYHFIIKEVAEEFEGQFEYLRKNTKKFITFSVPN